MTAPQRNYDDINTPAARAGLIIGAIKKEISCTLTGALKEIWTMVVTGATSDKDYVYESTDDLGNITVITYPSGAGATLASIANGIALKNNGTAAAGAYQSAVSDGVDTITFTGRFPNQAFTITESDGDLGVPTNTQNAAEAASLAMGRGAVRKGDGSCGAPNTTDLTNQLTRIIPVEQIAVHYNVIVRFQDTGDSYTADFLSVDAVLANICTGIATALDAALPANTADADGSSGTWVDLTSELPGISFEVTMSTTGPVGIGALSSAIITDSGAFKYLGSTRHSGFGEQEADGGDFVYPGRSVAPILQKGTEWVRVDAAVALGDKVYCRHTDSGTLLAGNYRTDRATNQAFHVNGTRWAKASKTGFDGHLIAALEHNLATL